MMLVLVVLLVHVLGVTGARAGGSACAIPGDGKTWYPLVAGELGEITFQWALDATTLYFQYTVDYTKGVAPTAPPTWIGWGLSETGFMAGSDLMIYQFSSGVQDYYVPWVSCAPGSNFPLIPNPAFFPRQDPNSQQWTVCAASASPTQSVTGSRPLVSADNYDRSLILGAGPQPMIFAYDCKGSLTYHTGYCRFSSVADIFHGPGVRPAPGSPYLYTGIYNTNVGQQTTYVCQTIDIGPNLVDIIRMGEYNDPNVVQGIALRHHITLHNCGTNLSAPIVTDHWTAGEPRPCQENATMPGVLPSAFRTGLSPLGQGPCKTMMFGWTKGGTDLIFPVVNGVQVVRRAGDDVARYMILETHLNNPDGLSHPVTGMGFMLWSIPRSDNVLLSNSITLGDPIVALPHTGCNGTDVDGLWVLDYPFCSTFAALKPQTFRHEEATCSYKCTQLLGHAITIFQHVFHMHISGRHQWLKLLQNTLPSVAPLSQTAGRIVGWKQFWNFGFQNNDLVQGSYTINPGDQLGVHCSWDTTNYGSNLSFGFASTNEMCLFFMFYYPETQISFCGRFMFGFSLCTMPDQSLIDALTCVGTQTGTGTVAGGCWQSKGLMGLVAWPDYITNIATLFMVPGMVIHMGLFFHERNPQKDGDVTLLQALSRGVGTTSNDYKSWGNGDCADGTSTC